MSFISGYFKISSLFLVFVNLVMMVYSLVYCSLYLSSLEFTEILEFINVHLLLKLRNLGKYFFQISFSAFRCGPLPGLFTPHPGPLQFILSTLKASECFIRQSQSSPTTVLLRRLPLILKTPKRSPRSYKACRVLWAEVPADLFPSSSLGTAPLCPSVSWSPC